MKYHALFVIFEKAAKFEIVICCKIIGGALRVKFFLFFNKNTEPAYMRF